MTELSVAAGSCKVLSEDPRRVHVFAERDLQAIEAALGAERPLLLLGEPGVGKSQLAEGAAAALGWHFVHKTVDALTEPGDLLWSEDAVSRLAEAQLAAVSQAGDGEAVRKRLGRENFVSPAVLWKAFDPADAGLTVGREGGADEAGVVALIDEIDKAESSVPNGLLEALGARQFNVPGRESPVKARRWPLVVITSNDERPLPKAFIRRCIVYHMVAPTGEAFVEWLVERGRAHYPDLKDSASLQYVAEATHADREEARRASLLPLPGLAEYLDLLRALFSRGSQDPAAIEQRVAEIGHFFLRKASH